MSIGWTGRTHYKPLRNEMFIVEGKYSDKMGWETLEEDIECEREASSLAWEYLIAAPEGALIRIVDRDGSIYDSIG